MAITASLVKELRERTGAGMMECKKALVETDGDIQAAIELMRKSGAAKAAKKASRVASEGLVVAKTSADATTAAILEVNCETDFVGRDENFVGFANAVAEVVLASGISDVATLSERPLGPESDATVEQARAALVAKIGENIQVRRAEIFKGEGSTFATYSHGNRIGVVVETKGGDADLGRDIAMHIAASNPEVVRPEQVDAARVEKEKDIFKAQAEQEGKPAEIIEKMIGGRVKKLLNEISLLGQEFVKDPSKNVEQLLKENSAEVVSFTRYELGEGIEKQEDNFAEEVMAQVRGE